MAPFIFSGKRIQMAARRVRRGRKVRKARRANKGRKTGRPRRSLGMFNDKGQMARIKETVAFTDLNPNLGYNFNFNLSQFRRASTIAPSFKWYKATMVEWTIEPLYNTFQDGTSGAEVSVPYIYMTMNRTQDKTGLGLADIQAIGAKPKKLVGKTVVKYKPNWCSPGLHATVFSADGKIYGGTQLGLQAQYAYLNCPDTNPGQNNPDIQGVAVAPGHTFPGAATYEPNYTITNQVIYNGHSVWVDQEVPTGTLQPVARVTCTVHWAFKDPHCTYLEDGAYQAVLPAA